MLFLKIIAGLTLYCSTSFLYAQTSPKLDELLKRVDQLEKHQESLLLNQVEPRPSVSSFLKDNLTIGGFFEPVYTIISGPDTPLQAANNSNILGVNLASYYKNRSRFVSQFLIGIASPLQNMHNNPNLESEDQPNEREFGPQIYSAILSQGYLEYFHNRMISIQGGVGYAPFGFAAQQRELVLFVRRGGPQILRTDELLNYQWSGVHLHGSSNENTYEWGYHFYTFTPGSYRQAPGMGGRLWWRSKDERVLAGVSSQIGKNRNETFEIIGLDASVELTQFILRTEFIQHLSSHDDPWSVYVEPGYYILEEEVLLYVFGDYVNSSINDEGVNNESDPYRKWEYGGGVNWLPTSYTRIRLGLTYNDYTGKTGVIDGKNRDYWSYDISLGVAF